MNNNLKDIINKYILLVESNDNRLRCDYWKADTVCSRDKFRRTPQKKLKRGIPVIADISPTIWADFFNFNMREFYTDPQIFLLNYLKLMIKHFELYDYLTLDKEIPCLFFPGIAFEASLFGKEPVYDDIAEPWVGRDIVLKEKKNLNKLHYPDFFKSGLMPLVHRFYQEINETLTGTGLNIDFPNMIRSPFGIAFQLRGFENLGIDLLDDPKWVHKLMLFLTESHKKWYEDKSKFLNEPIPKGLLYNDEVDCNLISPNIYEEIIFPYEIELAKFHNGIAYWHSCGNITPILNLIRQIPNMEMIKISAWTDYNKAAQICKDIPLEICISATDYVYLANKEKMASKINDIINICLKEGVEAFYIRTEPLHKFSSNVNQDLDKAQLWIEVAKNSIKKIRYDYMIY